MTGRKSGFRRVWMDDAPSWGGGKPFFRSQAALRACSIRETL